VCCRTGGGVRLGFEGGQTPLYKRIPKIYRPMKGHKRMEYELIKLNMLNEVPPNSTVDNALLLEMGVRTKANKGRKHFKVVGNGELTVPNLTVLAHAFTKSARAAIESLGGKCVVLSPTRHIPIEIAQAEKEARVIENLAKLKARRALKAKETTQAIV
jgi:large subunit ribosomal protein L15